MPDVSTADVPEALPTPQTRGQANRNIKYICSRCQREVGRENLVVTRTQFLEMGVSGKLLKTKTGGWVCRTVEDNCLDKDPFWTTERNQGAVPPGAS